MQRRGFTLLEMLVATFLMGVAVAALLANLSTSLNNASRLTEYDRAALLARRKMDELLLAPQLPLLAPLGGAFEPAVSGGVEAGWEATVSPFEMPQPPQPGASLLARIELEVWWKSGARRRTVALEAFRRVRAPEQAGALP